MKLKKLIKLKNPKKLNKIKKKYEQMYKEFLNNELVCDFTNEEAKLKSEYMQMS